MSRNWNLAYASHLGYLSPEHCFARACLARPMGSCGVRGRHRLSGVLYPWAISRPAEEVEPFHAALEHFQLLSSVIVYAPLERVTTPIWVRPTAGTISPATECSVPLAQRLGAPMLAVLVQGIEGARLTVRKTCWSTICRRAGDLAAKSGIVIGVEHWWRSQACS